MCCVSFCLIILFFNFLSRTLYSVLKIWLVHLPFISQKISPLSDRAIKNRNGKECLPLELKTSDRLWENYFNIFHIPFITYFEPTLQTWNFILRDRLLILPLSIWLKCSLFYTNHISEISRMLKLEGLLNFKDSSWWSTQPFDISIPTWEYATEPFYCELLCQVPWCLQPLNRNFDNLNVHFRV